MGHDYLEDNKVAYCDQLLATSVCLSTPCFVREVVFVFIALECDAVRSSGIKHQRVPGLTSCAAHEEEEGVDKGLEISVVVEVALKSHEAEQLHANHGEQKQE